MRVAILEVPGSIAIRTMPFPVPGRRSVVIRVRAALTCGTDLKAYVRGHPKMPTPTPFGHEYAGEIVEIGSEVVGWKVGDAVAGVHTGPCGVCYWCAHAQEELCETIMERAVFGAYAEYLELPDFIVRQNLFHKPSNLPYVKAAMLEPLACVMRGLDALDVETDDTVLIVGAGSIGLLHVLALQALGVHHIFLSARHAERLAVATKLGATIHDADQQDLLAWINDMTEGRGADIVIECTGRASVWEKAIYLARRGGQVCLFGGCPGGTAVTWEASRLHYDGVRLVSPFHFRPRDVRAAFELLASPSHKLEHFDHLLTATAPLEDLQSVFELLRAGKGIKYVIEP